MAYKFDDIDLGIGCITLIGVAGAVAMIYAMMHGVSNIDTIESFVLAIGGLIAALVRGKSV